MNNRTKKLVEGANTLFTILVFIMLTMILIEYKQKEVINLNCTEEQFNELMTEYRTQEATGKLQPPKLEDITKWESKKYSTEEQ